MTHTCVSKQTIIGSDNGLSPARRQAISWTNVGMSLIGPLGTSFSEMWNSYIFIQENPFENVVWKIAAIMSRPQCVKISDVLDGKRDVVVIDHAVFWHKKMTVSPHSYHVSVNHSSEIRYLNHDPALLESHMRIHLTITRCVYEPDEAKIVCDEPDKYACTQIANDLGSTSIRYQCRSEGLCYLGIPVHHTPVVRLVPYSDSPVYWIIPAERQFTVVLFLHTSIIVH